MTRGCVRIGIEGADLVDRASRQLTSVGACVISPDELNGYLGVGHAAWTRFGRHWEDLAPDDYAAELGTQRSRRYGHFLRTPANGTTQQMPHSSFQQPRDSNPLYVGRQRHFEQLTCAFTEDPLLHSLIGLLEKVASALDRVTQWSVKVTPFRVVATADDDGAPTPEGFHHDGVTLVTSLLVRRHNAAGGQSSVIDLDGNELLTVTLAQPGTLMLGDDRRTLHGVSPIRPVDRADRALRDVLVITFDSARCPVPDHFR